MLFCSKWCSASQLGLMYGLARKCRNKTNATFAPSPQKRRVRDSNRKYINGSSQSHVVLKMQNRSTRYSNKNLKRAFCKLTLQETKIQNHVFKSVLIIHKERLLITTLHLQNHNFVRREPQHEANSASKPNKPGPASAYSYVRP